MRTPPLSISAISTFRATWEEDLEAYRGAGCDGIGIWEYKLPAGRDEESLRQLKASGLRATICVPEVPTFIFDGFFAEPRDPERRLEAMCSAIGRLARFEPVSILLMSGDPANAPPGEARRLVVEGLRVAADVARDLGIVLGFEPLREASGGLVWTLPDALAIVDEVGRPNVRVIVDTWHLWDTPGFLESLRDQTARIGGVQLCDVREPTRSWCDRVLPGDGRVDLEAIVAVLEASGYDGWYDLEIFSDDGRFGNDFEDSLWKVPAPELAARGVASCRKLWSARTEG